MADSTLSLDVLKADGKKAGSVELPAAIFDVKTNIPLIHQVVVAQRHARAPTRPSVAVRSRAPAASPSSRRARVTPVRARSARRT